MKQFKYSKNSEERDSMLRFTDGVVGGTQHFNGLNVDVLKALIAKKHADPIDSQNGAPTIAEFVEFMTQYPFATAHGYAVVPSRSDYRLSIEGIEGCVPKDVDIKKFVSDFSRFAEGADDVRYSHDQDTWCRYGRGFYCWWD